MCRLYPRDTGLQGIIVNAVPHGNAVGPQLEVTVKRQATDNIDAVVAISGHPYIIEGALTPLVGRQVFRFIQRAQYVLLALWDGDLSCAEVSSRLEVLLDLQ